MCKVMVICPLGPHGHPMVVITVPIILQMQHMGMPTGIIGDLGKLFTRLGTLQWSACGLWNNFSIMCIFPVIYCIYICILFCCLLAIGIITSNFFWSQMTHVWFPNQCLLSVRMRNMYVHLLANSIIQPWPDKNTLNLFWHMQQSDGSIWQWIIRSCFFFHNHLKIYI